MTNLPVRFWDSDGQVLINLRSIIWRGQNESSLRDNLAIRRRYGENELRLDKVALLCTSEICAVLDTQGLGVVRSGWSSRNFWTRPKTAAHPAQLRKKHCPCIFENHLTTNPMLSALHLQSLKSNIYGHFHWVNKQLTGISLSKRNGQ